MQRDLKPEAVKLRRLGKTYSEIQDLLGPIPKGTLSGWLKNIELTATQKQRIKKKIKDKAQLGRQKGAWTNHQKRLKRIKSIQDQAKSEYEKLKSKDIFLTGLVLYLAEGSKKSEMFQFMNSDPHLIRLMIRWIETVSPIVLNDLKFRLYIHKVYESENCEAFWIEKLGVNPDQFKKTVYKPTVRRYKKNPKYKGCLRIEVSGSRLYWKVLAWRDCLYNELGQIY